MRNEKEALGLGVGLRNRHFEHILREQPPVDWFEAISENFMDSGGRPRACWVSDHLCWTGVLGVNSHDLLPLPLNDAVLDHVAARVRQAQELLERPLVLENPSTYLRFRDSTSSEPEFLRALCDATGCRLLLDVNNVYVSCFNAGTEPHDYLDAFPFERVVQLHVAGHQHCGTHIIDTHDQPVCDQVWALFRLAWQRTGGAATLLEWDGDVPPFERVHAEVLRARTWIEDAPPARAAQHVLGQGEPRHGARAREVLSTPLEFLVPRVMGDSRLCEA